LREVSFLSPELYLKSARLATTSILKFVRETRCGTGAGCISVVA
jgi:hypothetical protein